MEKIVTSFLGYLKIPVSKKYCEALILSHPDYPSLVSVADVLERFGINHKIYRIKKKKVDNLIYPYLLSLDTNKGEIAFIKNQNDLKALDIKYWNGVVLEAETTDTITDKENSISLSKEKLIKKIEIAFIIGISALVLFPILSLYSGSWIEPTLFSTSISGIILGYFLIAKEIGIKYKIIENFCKVGKNTNCDRILNAEDLKLFGIFKFSDAVISYFIFQLITICSLIILPNQRISIIFGLTILSLLSILIVVFSLYYQRFKARIWCKLCLIVDAILIVQSIVFVFAYFSYGVKVNHLDFLPIIGGGLLFFVISLLILLITDRVKNIEKVVKSEIISKRIKYSTSVFEHLLFKQKKVDCTPFSQELLIGNPNAPVRITMASNLYCGPCKEQHAVLSQLVSSYPDKVRVAIRFVSGRIDVGKTVTSNQYILQYWLENILDKSNESVNTGKMMHEWYKKMNLDEFKKLFPIKQISEKSKLLETQQTEWIKEVDIPFTPTFFINGYQIPQIYNLMDMMALMPGLADSFQKSQIKTQISL